jgi:dTDP-4-amino-4,6-dideoxygalactose transaminase
VTIPINNSGNEHVYHQYVIRHSQRDEMHAFLRARKILTLIHYPTPIHLQPAYRGRLGDSGSFPVSELAAREILSLPLYPELTDAQATTVVQAITAFCERAGR